MINLNKVSEGIHYDLIPAESENDQAWDVRIKEGDYVETVIRFGNIAFNDEQECLTFNFVIVYSPDYTLTTEDTNLQQYVGAILEDVLERAIEKGELITRERDGHD